MAEFEASRGMSANSVIVFGIASDVDLMDRWLPHGLSVHGSGPGTIEADGPLVPGSGKHEGLFRASEEQLRVEWGGRDHPDYAGWLQVADTAAGASEVTLHISLLDEPDSGDRANEVRELLGRSLDRLAEEVGLRTDGP
ncbi:Polyketide cyclase / dehydrase and lipid transport [Nonomuraea solani]|uniref:Polyketide cyclase / dehydrase and lipid transport n=1 Tax=Nonomuraea solani TaxID=1144553 RepID=A0A1H6EGQ1_9ACTN|nr:SRPBCC family protein [Nonomuraea solani]SEG96952.1 Polyketide cyclase / dehydrase and lipid transport [Nonomuraea solani]